MSGLKSWADMLKEEFKKNGEDYATMVTTLSYRQLHEKFYTGYGGINGKPFTAWGEKFVYFPVGYDGAEWVGSVPRNPCEIASEHLGRLK